MGGGHGVIMFRKGSEIIAYAIIVKQNEQSLYAYEIEIYLQNLVQLIDNKLYAGVAQLVEHHLAKVDVEGSNPFARSIKRNSKPHCGHPCCRQ